MYHYMEEWDALCHDVLAGEGDNPRLLETIDERFVGNMRNHSNHFTIDLHIYDNAPIGTPPHTLSDMENKVRQLIDRVELDDHKTVKLKGPAAEKGDR